MKRVGYQTVYLWTCPDCGTTWQPRRRPRAGADLICAAHAMQQRVLVDGEAGQGCGAVNTSEGHREGIAPNVKL